MAAKSGDRRGGRREGAGRKPGFIVSDRLREKIKAGVIVSRLQRIASGDVDEAPDHLNVQVRAGLGLLAKVLPDLQAVTHDGSGWTGEIRHVIEVMQVPQQLIAHKAIDVQHETIETEK